MFNLLFGVQFQTHTFRLPSPLSLIYLLVNFYPGTGHRRNMKQVVRKVARRKREKKKWVSLKPRQTVS